FFKKQFAGARLSWRNGLPSLFTHSIATQSGGVSSLSFAKMLVPATSTPCSKGRQSAAPRHHRAHKLEGYLGRAVRSGRREGGLDRAAERRIHQEAESRAGHGSLRGQQPVGHRHGEGSSTGLDRGQSKAAKVANRWREVTTFAAEEVEPGKCEKLPRVSVEPAHSLLPDRYLARSHPQPASAGVIDAASRCLQPTSWLFGEWITISSSSIGR